MGWDLLRNLLLTFAEYVKVLRAFAPNSAQISFSESLESISSANMLAVEFINLFWLLWFFFCVEREAMRNRYCRSYWTLWFKWFSHHHFLSRAGSLAAARKLKASCSNGPLWPSKLNLMIDAMFMFIRCGQERQSIVNVYFAAFTKCFYRRTWLKLRLALNYRNFRGVWLCRRSTQFEHTIDWFCWGRASERARGNAGGGLKWRAFRSVFVLLDLKPFPMIKLCSEYMRD